MTQKSVWGAKLMFGGYSGLKHTAVKINDYIPNSKIYVESFSGLGRTVQLRHEKIILNDKSEFANNYCKKKFPNAIVENMDFKDTIIKYDSKDTFFLFDPVWRFSCYDSHENAYCDRKPIEYYTQLLELTLSLKGNFIICSAVDEHEIKHILSKTAKKRGYFSKIVESDKKVIFGKKARTLLVSNIQFLKQNNTDGLMLYDNRI